MKPWKWYVYELYDDVGVFYVGKGSGARVAVFQREGSLPKVARAKSGKSRIIAYFKTEAAQLFEKVSEEINRCQEVARAQGLVDLLALAIGKLLRSSKPLSPAESRRLITCSA